MEQMWFFAKTLGASLVIVLILQIHIGGTTIEQKAIALASHSMVLAPVEGVVEASVISFHRTWDRLTNRLKSQAVRPGAREAKLHIERHPDAIKKTPDDVAAPAN